MDTVNTISKADNKIIENTIIMLDDNTDEIFMTRRKMRKNGIVNRFYSEKNPENLFHTLDEICASGTDPRSIIILLDISMPKISGFDIAKQIRNHETYREVGILMLSGSEDMDDMFRAYDAGANSYLVKPLDSEEFFAAIQSVPKIKHRLVRCID